MVTFIRKYLLNAYTALPLLVCLMFTTWSSYANPLTSKSTHRYSGEEMFRGLFFLDGQYAKALPELQSLQMSYSKHLIKTADQAVLTQMRNEMIQSIKAQNPRYFEQFRAALESGNYLKVQSALNEGKKLATQTIEKLYNLDPAQLGQLQNQASKLAQEGKLTKESLDNVVKNLNKHQYASRQDKGTCVVIVLYNVCTIVLICAIVTMISAEEIAYQDSTLFNDQLVASICQLANHSA